MSTGTSPTRPSIGALILWAATHRHLAVAVREARAFGRSERERVARYANPIFWRFAFRDRNGKAITDRDLLYTSCEEDEVRWPAYFEELDAAHRANGFAGPKDHCPALIAETRQHEAERALIQAGAVLFGIADVTLYGEERKSFIELLTQACFAGQ